MKRNYYVIWKLFNKFILKLDLRPKSWEDRIVLFVGYLISEKKQSAMMRSYISGLRTVLKTGWSAIA